MLPKDLIKSVQIDRCECIAHDIEGFLLYIMVLVASQCQHSLK